MIELARRVSYLRNVFHPVVFSKFGQVNINIILEQTLRNPCNHPVVPSPGSPLPLAPGNHRLTPALRHLLVPGVLKWTQATVTWSWVDWLLSSSACNFVRMNLLSVSLEVNR